MARKLVTVQSVTVKVLTYDDGTSTHSVEQHGFNSFELIGLAEYMRWKAMMMHERTIINPEVDDKKE